MEKFYFKKNVIILILSILNILFLSYSIYLNKDFFYSKKEYEFSNDANVTKNISGMNAGNLPTTIEGSFNVNSDREIKVLIIGNSIAYHAPSAEIGWHHGNGMAASNINKDYAHLLLKKYSESKKINVKFIISNFYEFERSYKSFNLATIDYLANFKPDIVIFQLGENVVANDASLAMFKNNYVKLISRFAESKKIITTPFYPSLKKNEVIKNVALTTGSHLVDLSHLVLLDKTNYAKSERSYTFEGVGIHPGDTGMKNIADVLFITMTLIEN